MAKQQSTRNKRSSARRATPVELGPRTVWLAGIGAVSLARQQGAHAVSVLVEEGHAVNERLAALRGDIEVRAASLQRDVIAHVEPIRENLESRIGELRRQIVTRVQPWLQRFGFAAAPRRARTPTRKGTRTATAKRGGRRVARKAA